MPKKLTVKELNVEFISLQEELKKIKNLTVTEDTFKRLNKIDGWYDHYMEVEPGLKKIIPDLETSLEKSEKNLKEIRNELSKLNQLSETKDEELSILITTLTKKVDLEIESHKKKLTTSKTKLQTYIEEIKSEIEIDKKVHTQELKKIEVRISDKEKTLTTLLSDTELKVKDLVKETQEKCKKTIESIEEECLELLVKTKDTALSKDFSNRSDNLRKMNMKYLGMAVFGLVVLIIANKYFIEFDKAEIFTIKNIRSSVLSTILISVGIFLPVKEYLKGRRLEEDYVFKSMIAGTMDDYRKLIDNVEKDKGQGLDMLKKAIEQVYKDPTYEEKETSYEKTINKIIKNIDRDIKVVKNKEGLQVEIAVKKD